MVIAATPVPVSATACGLLVALSAMLNVPERAPVAVGVNTMAMLQLLRCLSKRRHEYFGNYLLAREPRLLIKVAIMNGVSCN